MTADEMLLEEGYKFIYENEYEIKYENNVILLGDHFDFILLFCKKTKIYFHKDNQEKAIGISKGLHKAINKKISELGWNRDRKQYFQKYYLENIKSKRSNK